MAKFVTFDGFDWELRDFSNLHDKTDYICCEYIDIVSRWIGNHNYDIIIDDCGLLKDDNIITAFDPKTETGLAGKLIIGKTDKEGEWVDMDQEDLDIILSRSVPYIYEYNGKIKFNYSIMATYYLS